MKQELLELLVDPQSRSPLTLVEGKEQGREIWAGTLRSTSGVEYQIHRGIPRLVGGEDCDQARTAAAFAFKWKKRDTYDSQQFTALLIPWMLRKFGFADVDTWQAFFRSRRRVLDLGCGSGLASSLWLNAPGWGGEAMWIGLDISEAVDVARERLGHLPNTHFVQGDALCLPFPDNCFDTIYSDGVLHHTPSTRAALVSAARVLAPGGEFHFYVYRKKGPIREFTDDYIREQISGLSEEGAWEVMRGLTRLARSLAELQTSVIVPEDIPLLGIRAGTQDVQRFIYWNFSKLYWNAELSFEENVHVNFDWYRPRYAFRQTAEEVHQWSMEAGLAITWFHEQESGYSVRAVKQAGTVARVA